jgi:5-methylcytosine-specific restriction protein A
MAALLFLNVGEMSKYEGLKSDAITGGGKNVELHGYGGEILNFKKFRGRMYGYAHAPHDSINVQKLGAQKNEDHADGVLVIWVAKSHIVGWYKNATVFRKVQAPPTNSARTYKGHPIKYNATAKATDCTRIDRDERHFAVPRARERKKWDGQVPLVR